MEPEEKICERCHQVKRVASDTCPDDGGRLLAVANEQALIGRVIDDKLTLTSVLGKGGMGVVYRAQQHSMDREVAVKILHPSFATDTEAVRRFLHEARAATRLDHPNVITVFDFGRTDDGLLYIVMELLNGHGLGDEIEHGPMEPVRAVNILTQVCDAVHHAHERGLVHRDLKPDNVVLVQSSSLRGDFVKVLDFGIAMMRSYDGIERITRTGAVCGTPGYMSPEQVLGDEVDPRSDVYALGIIAYELLTGMHPLPADTAMRQMLAHLETVPPRMSALVPGLMVPEALENAIARALEKKREHRTETALQLANEMLAALGMSDPHGPSPSPVRWPSKPPTSGASHVSSGASREKSGRGLADTARATALPTARTAPARWRAYLPHAGILAVLVLAVVFLATRTGDDKVASPVDPVTAASTSAPPAPAPAPTPAPASATTLEPAPPAHESATPPPSAPEPAPEPANTPAPTPEPAPAPEPTPASAPEPTPAPRLIALTSIPTGALVSLDGRELGTTPLDVPLPPAGSTASLLIKKPGYRPENRVLDATATDLRVTLTRANVTGRRSDAPPIIK